MSLLPSSPEAQESDSQRPSGLSRSRQWVLLVFFVFLALVMAATGASAGLLLRQRQIAASDGKPTPRPGAPLVDANPTGTPDSTSGPDARAATPGRIVYVNGDGQLVTVNPDGSDSRRLTIGRRQFQFPAWSPDGQKIAAIGGSLSQWGIYLLDEQQTNVVEPTPLFEDVRAPIYLFWSPDSSSVSFLATQPRGLGLFLASPGHASRLLATGQPLYWDWMPDGSRILFHAGAGGPEHTLAFLAPDEIGSGEDIMDPGRFQAPGISYSGQYWAYSEREEDGTLWLVVQNALGAPEFRFQHGGFLSIGWSRRQESLAYISPEPDAPTSAGPLYLLDTTSGENHLISAETVRAFFWSPDGTKIAVIAEGLGARINAQAPLHRVKFRGQIQSEKDSQLDLLVIDTETRRSTLVTSFTPTRLFEFQFLPFFDQYALSHQLWSPDGKQLVLPMLMGRIPHIVVVPVDGSEPTLLGVGDMAFWSP